MKRKNKSVSLVGLQPEMKAVLETVHAVYSKYKQDPVITAGVEAFDSNNKLIHSVGSLHPFGYALDFRTRDFKGNTKGIVVYELRELLGNDYDVILHTTHLHIEFDPK